MPTMSHTRFREILKALNPNLELVPSQAASGSMVYLYCAGHPDAGPSGMVEIAAVPNKRYSDRIPRDNFIDSCGMRSRGYGEFFRKLIAFKLGGKKRLVDPGKVRKLVPDFDVAGPVIQSKRKFSIHGDAMKDAPRMTPLNPQVAASSGWF